MAIYGYARVSTKGQAKDGNSLEAQEKALKEAGVTEVFSDTLNIGIMDNTPSSKLIRNIFFAFAEFERDMIVERTQEGKAIAKQNPDFKEGRPQKFDDMQIENAMKLLDQYSYNQVVKLTGISKSTLIRAKKQREGS